MSPLVETGTGEVADNGSWALGVASETGELYSEGEVEDPVAGVAGEAEA
jgi:hypothetical protein